MECCGLVVSPFLIARSANSYLCACHGSGAAGTQRARTAYMPQQWSPWSTIDADLQLREGVRSSGESC